MSNSKEVISARLDNFEKKIKDSFSLIKEDINKISSKTELSYEKLNEKERIFQEKIEKFGHKISELNVIIASISTLKQKFALEVKRYKEETRMLREVLKNQEKRIRELENYKLLESQEPKFWASWVNP